MEEVSIDKCKCPYYDGLGDETKDPECRNPNPCDYPFYCPIKERKSS